MKVESLKIKGNQSSCQLSFESLHWPYSRVFEANGITFGFQSNDNAVLDEVQKRLSRCKTRETTNVDMAYSLHVEKDGVALYFSWSALSHKRLALDAAVRKAMFHLEMMFCWRTKNFLGIPAHLVKTATGLRVCLGPSLPENPAILGDVIAADHIALYPNGKCRGIFGSPRFYTPTEVCYFGAADDDSRTAHFNEVTKPLAYCVRHPKAYLNSLAMLLFGKSPTNSANLRIFSEKE